MVRQAVTPAKGPRKTKAARQHAKAIVAAEQNPSDAELDRRTAEAQSEVIDAPYDAYQMRIAGKPWAEVARATGYGSASTCQRAVSAYLQSAAAAQSAQHQQEALQLAIDRYEAIVREWWELGTTGKSEKAAGVLLRALERLDRVQRLTEGDVTVNKETLVISGDPVEYALQLQRIAEQRNAEKKS